MGDRGSPGIDGSAACLRTNRAPVGDGGRFLILHLPKVRQVAVFDVNQAKVVKFLPVAADNVMIAAGMTKMIVAYPAGIRPAATAPSMRLPIAMANANGSDGPGPRAASAFPPN